MTLNNGTLQFGGSGITLVRNVFLGTGGGTFDVSLNSATISSVIANQTTGGALTVTGAGMLTLTNTNTYSGGTTIGTGATLQVGTGGTNGTLGSGAINDNGTLAINLSSNYVVLGAISGSGGVNQNGTGTTTLAAGGSYAGATNVNSGVLQVNAALSGSTAVTVASGAILLQNNVGLSVSTLSGSGFVVSSLADTLTLGSAVGSTTAFNGVISGPTSFFRQGGGITQLGGNNLYTGSTSIQTPSSQLVLEKNNALPTTTTLTTSATGGANIIVDLNGNNQQIGALSVTTITNGSFIIQNSGSGVNTLTINGTGTFAPVSASADTGTTTIEDGTGGIALTIIGGTLTFRSTAQTYSHGTMLNGGSITLDFTGANSIAAITNMLNPAGNITFAGGTLTGTGKASATNSQTFNNGITLNPGASAISATGGTSGTMTFTLNGITRNPGSTMNFIAGTGSHDHDNDCQYAGQRLCHVQQHRRDQRHHLGGHQQRHHRRTDQLREYHYGRHGCRSPARQDGVQHQLGQQPEVQQHRGDRRPGPPQSQQSHDFAHHYDRRHSGDNQCRRLRRDHWQWQRRDADLGGVRPDCDSE